MLDLLLAAAVMLTPQTASTTWQVIDINDELQRVLTVDTIHKATTVKTSGIVKARVFVTVDMPEISALTGFWSIDCGKKMHRVSETVTFDAAGTPSAPDPVPLKWEATPAGSLFEAVSNYVCRGEIKHPGVTLKGAAPITDANTLFMDR